MLEGSFTAVRRFVPVNKYLGAISALVLATSIIQLTRLFPLPFTDLLCASAGSLLSSGSLSGFIDTYGYESLFLLMALEGASAPIPSEVILPIAGALAAKGVISLPLALVVSTAAALTGAMADYYLAFFLGRSFVLKLLRLFRLDKRDLDRAEGWFVKSGQWTVFAARFVPLVRALISFPAGLFRMGLRPFVAMTLVGCTIWNAVLLYAGFSAGKFFDSVCLGPGANLVADGFALAAGIVAVAYLVYYSFSWLRSLRNLKVSPGA